MSTRRTYADAGVSVEANDEAVGLIAKGIAAAGATRPEVLGQVGGFAGAFEAGFKGVVDPIMISATDGVGTKLSIAQTMGRHDTVGFDLVAMVVDDIVCAGAEPLFLLDYIVCGRNVPERTAEIVEGIARAAASAGCALLGGETAEHPGLMDDDEYDLAAFGVGVVGRADMLGPERVRAGDVVIGLASSGVHSNGFSLIRSLILDLDLDLTAHADVLGAPLGEVLLTPCRIHAPAVLAACREVDVRAAAHITGGGLAANLARALPEGLGARLERTAWSEHPIFPFLQEAGGISDAEMDRVFNRGVGMAVIVARDSVGAALDLLEGRGETTSVIGEVVPTPGVEIG